jgi:hypothetical protein
MLGFGGGLLVDLIGYGAKRYNEWAEAEILRLRGKAQYTVTYECDRADYQDVVLAARNPVEEPAKGPVPGARIKGHDYNDKL